MDKKTVLIGVIILTALVGGIVLSMKGIAMPAWLASFLTVAAWFMKPPGGDAPPADGAK